MRPNQGTLIVALIGAAAIAVATFLPWQKSPLNGEVSGFGSGGWVTLILAVIAALNLMSWRITGRVRDARIAAAVGVAAFLTAGYLLYDFASRTEGLFEESRTSEPMAGVFIALGGAVVLTGAALLLPGSKPEPDSEPDEEPEPDDDPEED